MLPPLRTVTLAVQPPVKGGMARSFIRRSKGARPRDTFESQEL
jgi:hypothetical protein